MDHKLIEELRSRKQARQKKKKRLMIAAGLLIFVGLMLITGFLFWRRHGPLQDDPNASTQKPLTKVEQQAALQKAADESRFRFKMNTAPTVTWSGDLEDEQEADWYIINSMENPWDMEVVITSAQDGSELYRSARLKPGERELSGPLETTLEPGSYTAVATATAIDPESGETAGTVSADLTLTVEAKQQN